MATKKTTTKTKAPNKKTAPKKTTAAKTTKRRTTTAARAPAKRKQTQASTALPAAMAQEAFWVSDGEILHTMADLADALRDMDEITFGHHVNRQKNDFATWVEEVLGETDCAADLRRAKTPRSARTATLKCLRNYNL